MVSLENKQEFILFGHKSYISSVVIADDNATIVLASYDRTVRLWETTTQSESQIIRLKVEVVSIKLASDRKNIPICLYDGSVIKWNFLTQQQVVIDEFLCFSSIVTISNDCKFFSEADFKNIHLRTLMPKNEF